MHFAEDLALGFRIEPVREPAEPLVQPSPELDPVGHVRWQGQRAEGVYVLLAHLSVLSMGLDQAKPQPTLGLAEANEHCVVAFIPGTLRRGRFLCHYSAAIATHGDSRWSI